MPLLEVRNVGQTFQVSAGMFRGKKPLRAVDDVSFTLARGRTLGLVGESGCGKSTLAKMILGLLAPSEGEILIEGRPVSKLPRRELAQLIQPIFQDPYSSLNPRRTVEQIIRQPLDVNEVGTPGERSRRVTEMLDLVRLPSRARFAYPNQLSGGQRQRIAIGRALILHPSLVICDEPTSALDVSVQAQILNILIDLRHELGLSYLFVSHNLAVVEHLAEDVAVMYLGRVVERATTEQVFGAPKHPYTRALLESVLTPDPDLGVPKLALGSSFPNPMDPPSGCPFHPRCPKVFEPCP
ncbi:MAG TPA: oligopeptide/dipeptide ABC transporter ATP-binding protein, partial [Paracoccaceae bacterium]|nr:oligopeptide/dipeptide ABC transporter ATP-binding protein [Paracoccaceae bacterium]